MYNFMGQTGSEWFIGIVEDNLDPEKIGRVKVRCYGIHSENKTELPTEHLDWWLVGVSTNSSSSDIATIQIGACVKGIFLDGIDMQVGLVEYVIPGLHTNTDIATGFSNLKKNPPKEGTHSGNPYSRVEGIPERTYYGKFTSARGNSIQEPQGTRKPIYPYNIASMSDTGHVIERDDTQNNERVSIQDKNSSYIEMSKGNIVTKAIKDIYNLCVNYYQGITNSRVISVGAGDYLKVISGDKVIEVSNGDFYIEASNAKFFITGDIIMEANGNGEFNVGGSMNISAGGQLELTGSTVSVNGSVINLN